jgi:hypothetical protein
MRYNTPNTPMDSMKDFVTRGGIPVTITLLGINVLTFLAAFFSPTVAAPFLESQMVFSTANMLHAPWTLLTYPLVAGPFSLWLIVTWVFFWLTGGSLERSWGSARFAAFFFALTAVSALSLFLGGLLLHEGVPSLNDVFLPLTGLIVAFCMLNPEQTLVVYFFPVKAKYLALIATAWTYFTYGSFLGPGLGAFALGGIFAAFLYVRFGRSWSSIGSYTAPPRRSTRGPDLRVYPPASKFSTKPKPRMLDGSSQRSPLDFLGRWKDYQERKRLEKLWKNSGFTEPEERWRDDDGRRR